VLIEVILPEMAFFRKKTIAMLFHREKFGRYMSNRVKLKSSSGQVFFTICIIVVKVDLDL